MLHVMPFLLIRQAVESTLQTAKASFLVVTLKVLVLGNLHDPCTRSQVMLGHVQINEICMQLLEVTL